MHDSPDLPPPIAARPGLRAVTTATVFALLTTACTPPDEAAEPRTTCASAVADAAEAAEVVDTVRLLDTALVACRSYAALAGEIDRHPGIIGYDTATFVELRCAKVTDELVRSSPTCERVISPPSTVPPTTLPDLVFVGDTLDGRTIEIRPSATVQFVGDVPAVVQQTVDIAFEGGCEGLVAQRDTWAARAGDPVEGDIASVYAQHAQNVAIYVGCEPGPIPEFETG